jgi:hypothetical protein
LQKSPTLLSWLGLPLVLCLSRDALAQVRTGDAGAAAALEFIGVGIDFENTHEMQSRSES